jgi:uncharacterized protein
MKPFEAGYFEIADDGRPRLWASYSPEADLYYFPQRKVCAVTLGPVESRLLSGAGVLYSWTYVHEDRFGPSTGAFSGYGVGQIDLPEGVRIQARILGRLGDWAIGMPMEIDILALFQDGGPLVDAEGNELVTFCFRPADDA